MLWLALFSYRCEKQVVGLVVMVLFKSKPPLANILQYVSASTLEEKQMT